MLSIKHNVINKGEVVRSSWEKLLNDNQSFLIVWYLTLKTLNAQKYKKNALNSMKKYFLGKSLLKVKAIQRNMVI